MDSISKGVKNNGEYDMWLTPYISNISKCENARSSQQNVEEAASAANIKEMGKIANKIKSKKKSIH